MEKLPDLGDLEALAREHDGVPAFLEWPDPSGHDRPMLEPLFLHAERRPEGRLILHLHSTLTGEERLAFLIGEDHLEEARRDAS